MKTLRIEIQKATCISCKRQEDGSLRDIQRLPSGKLQASMDPPDGWVRAAMDYIDRSTQVSTYKVAFVCSTCFVALPEFGQSDVIARVIVDGAQAP